jgi:hypothetical protein
MATPKKFGNEKKVSRGCPKKFRARIRVVNGRFAAATEFGPGRSLHGAFNPTVVVLQ